MASGGDGMPTTADGGGERKGQKWTPLSRQVDVSAPLAINLSQSVAKLPADRQKDVIDSLLSVLSLDMLAYTRVSRRRPLHVFAARKLS